MNKGQTIKFARSRASRFGDKVYSFTGPSWTVRSGVYAV